jgi:hypothetical protein
MGPSATIQYQDHTDFGFAEAPGRRRKICVISSETLRR